MPISNAQAVKCPYPRARFAHFALYCYKTTQYHRYSHCRNFYPIGLGWDTNVGTGAEFDLDASVFLLDEKGKVKSDKDFMFYNNLTSVDGSVVHSGDNRAGDGDRDDESIRIDLSKIPSSVKEIAVDNPQCNAKKAKRI